jgi:hypothetical protein
VRNGMLLPTVVLAAAILALGGCQREEQIEHYVVPRIEMLPAAQVGKKEPVRFLGAILPSKDEVWFLKLVGPEAAVTPLVEPFEKFIKTIRFTDKAEPPVTWDLPADWQQLPGREFRYATIKIKSETETLELVVSKLGKEASSVLDNVNRWRGQIQLEPIGKDKLPDATKSIDVAGVNVTLVNMLGTSGGNAGMPPRFAKDGPQAPPFAKAREQRDAKIDFQLPSGWKELEPKVEFAVKQFEVPKNVTVTITESGGGLPANVNRWRTRLKLPELKGDALLEIIKPLDGEKKAAHVDVENPKEPDQPRILGAFFPGEGRMIWVVKMWGPSDAVGREKANFEAFAKSLRFDGK